MADHSIQHTLKGSFPATYRNGFGWRTKHDPERFERHGDQVWLWPLKGSMLIESRPYKAGMPDVERDAARALMDAMPDYVPVIE